MKQTLAVGAVAVAFVLGALMGWPWQGDRAYLSDPRFEPIYVACQEDEALVPATGQCLPLDGFILLGGNVTCTSSTSTERTEYETTGGTTR